MRRRSNLLILVGLLAFVLGLAAVYLVTRDDDDGDNVAGGSDGVEVIVATGDLSAGMSGDDLVADGLVEIRRVERNEVQPNAVLTRSQLTNTLLTANVAEDDQLVSTVLRPRSILAQQVELPVGLEAVAVDIDFVSAGAGYVTPGDRVNVYLVSMPCTPDQLQVLVEDDAGTPLPTNRPAVELLLTNVQVLDVSQTSAPLRGTTQAATTSDGSAASSGRATTSNGNNLLMALSTLDVQKVVFGSTAPCQSLYVTLVSEDAAPAGPTEATDFLDILAEEAIDAYNRSNPAGS